MHTEYVWIHFWLSYKNKKKTAELTRRKRPEESEFSQRCSVTQIFFSVFSVREDVLPNGIFVDLSGETTLQLTFETLSIQEKNRAIIFKQIRSLWERQVEKALFERLWWYQYQSRGDLGVEKTWPVPWMPTLRITIIFIDRFIISKFSISHTHTARLARWTTWRIFFARCVWLCDGGQTTAPIYIDDYFPLTKTIAHNTQQKNTLFAGARFFTFFPLSAASACLGLSASISIRLHNDFSVAVSRAVFLPRHSGIETETRMRKDNEKSHLKFGAAGNMFVVDYRREATKKCKWNHPKHDGCWILLRLIQWTFTCH